METVQWKVDGMDCTNCALTIHKYLDKQGMKNVKVNFGTGDVSFDINDIKKEGDLAKGVAPSRRETLFSKACFSDHLASISCSKAGRFNPLNSWYFALIAYLKWVRSYGK